MSARAHDPVLIQCHDPVGATHGGARGCSLCCDGNATGGRTPRVRVNGPKGQALRSAATAQEDSTCLAAAVLRSQPPQAAAPRKRGTIGARFGCRRPPVGPQCEVAARALRPCREQARRRLASRLEWLSRGTGPRRHHRRRMAAARLHRASGRQRRSVRPFDDRTNPRPWHRRHRHHLGSAVSPHRRGDLGDWHRPGPRHRRRPMRGAVNGPGVGPGLGIRREVVLLSASTSSRLVRRPAHFPGPSSASPSAPEPFSARSPP